MIAVICGDRVQFEVWASRNPELAGPQLRNEEYENAICLTCLMDTRRLDGRDITSVDTYGTYYQLPDFRKIEAIAHEHVRRCYGFLRS